VNLAQKILDELARAPHRPVLHELSPTGGILRTLSASTLLAEAAAWQARFAADGLRPGDAAGLSPARNSSLPALHLAALASGLAVVPVNSALSERERDALLREAKLERVYGEPNTATAEIASTRAEVEDPSPPAADADPADTNATQEVDDASVAVADGSPVVADRSAADTALVLYTSGTTGRPKSVPLSHANLLYDLEALADAWARSREDRLLHMLPAHHFHGLVLAMYGSLLCGCETYLLPRFDARAALDAVSNHGITLIMGVPTMYARMLDAAETGDDPSSLRLAISGSAPLAASTWTRFRDRFGVELVERYGLTETGIVSTNPPDAPKPGSVGKPLEGTRIAIFDGENLHEFSDARSRERGEIAVSGPSVMPGYGNAPEENRAAFVDGWFRTGDLGYFDDTGYLHIDGRSKELIIVGGTNVLPGEVERALEEVAGVRELAAAGAPDDDLGEIVAIFAVLAENADEDAVRAALENAARENLAAYKRPRRIRFVAELPRNAMGKVDRGRLGGG
jgi:malonyl-CoA/methylmalonyl-CoA synthetase